MKILTAILFSMLLILSRTAPAQTPEPDKPKKTTKTLVSVPVAVSDREGHYISGLKKKDFAIYEDGIKQNISLFETEEEPLNIALLLDTSGSTEDSLGKIKDAAKDFIELLSPNDRAQLVTFDSEIKILNPFTSEHRTLKKSIERVQTAAKDGTLFYRAVQNVAENSFAGIEGRKVIVLLSDGKDYGSSAVTKDKLLNLLEESDVLIYTIFYKSGIGFNKLTIDADGNVTEGKESKESKESKDYDKPKPVKKKKKEYTVFIPNQAGVPSEEEVKFIERNTDVEAVELLREISDATAGRFYLSDTPKLKDVFKRIAGELKQQYRLGFRSKEATSEAAIHTITVKVERPDTVVRARGKYRAKQL
jgi:VWFA-related protein